MSILPNAHSLTTMKMKMLEPKPKTRNDPKPLFVAATRKGVGITNTNIYSLPMNYKTC